MAAGTHESAGKRRAAASVNGNRWLGRSLIEAARAAARTRNTYFAAQNRRLAARQGPNRASVAVVHSMVITAWHMLSTGETYEDLGGVQFACRADPDRQARRLTRQLEQLGFDVTLSPAA